MGPDGNDWIDRVIARDGMWEPPAGYADRVAAKGMAFHSQRHPLASRMTFMDVIASMRLRLEGSLWVARQYRELLRMGYPI